MLSRLRLSPQKLWWLLMLLPAFIIMEGWVFDAGIAYWVTGYGWANNEMNYFWWAVYDLCAKSLAAFVIASLLVTNHDRIRFASKDYISSNLAPMRSSLSGVGRVRQLAPWIVVIVLWSIESYIRSDLDNPWLKGVLPTSITWRRLIWPSPSGWYFPSELHTLLWALRPIITFAISALLIWTWRLLIGQLQAQKLARLQHNSEPISY